MIRWPEESLLIGSTQRGWRLDHAVYEWMEDFVYLFVRIFSECKKKILAFYVGGNHNSLS